MNLHSSWQKPLQQELQKEYFEKLTKFILNEYDTETVYPAKEYIFNAFELCPLDKVKVVILGQDPYHEPNQANGLCFSVNHGVKIPPSLRNIFKELNDDLGIDIPSSGDLSHWGKQGVLMLNSILTVRAHEAGSHSKKGWESFTNKIIELVASQDNRVIFILWGRYAKMKGAFIDTEKHLVLTSNHPSPLSANRGGFFKEHHFSKCNEDLIKHGRDIINW